MSFKICLDFKIIIKTNQLHWNLNINLNFYDDATQKRMA